MAPRHGLECLGGQTRLVRQRGQRLSGSNLLQDFSGQIYFPKRVILWYTSDFKAILPIVRYASYLKFEEIYYETSDSRHAKGWIRETIKECGHQPVTEATFGGNRGARSMEFGALLKLVSILNQRGSFESKVSSVMEVGHRS